MFIRIVVFFYISLISTAGWSQTVFRCVGSDGKTTLQQTPCSAAPAKSGHQFEGAVRNAVDPEMTATIRRCQGATLQSQNFPLCSATLLCVDRGYVGSDLRACLRDSQKKFAKVQEDWREAEKQAAREQKIATAEIRRQATRDRDQAAAEAAELTVPNNPRNFIKAGQVFNNLDLDALINKKYPNAKYHPNQTITIPFQGATYFVVTQKINLTDVPARYRIVSIAREHPEVSEVVSIAPTAESREDPTVDCFDLSRVAKLLGHNFIERAAIVSDARGRGVCR